ncbi:MAG: sodium-dependent transporter [Cyclobacteriaceae bacterium]|nr:sodium-dependent transporter [Cyclobacteriaceae bacterium]MDH4296094.1 sodium-dependent transporter [Cyclobacteriaceae bacterium]MDH5250284.1 sodium-dependent transporter [Cyclobacteriaceae bacterium]
MPSVTRGGFSSRIGFILAAAGSAVGLGNIWKFPYEAGKNGGAAFLVVYFLLTFLFCYPIMVGEIAIGRRAGKDVYGSYKLLGNKNWGLLGLLGILCGIMILSFYNVVAGWAFGYFLEISFGNLLSEPDYGKFFGNYVNDFWDNLLFSLGFMAITAYIVAKGVKQGIEAASKIMMPALLLILLLLIGYSLTLPNAMKGISFYLLPDFSKITLDTIYPAMGHAFFSLSLGMGALITYGSYVEKKQNIMSAAFTITIMDMSVAFLAGLMIFPLIFSQGVAPDSGPSLVFVVLPSIFKAFGPVLGKVVGGSFFLLLCFAALTSTISLLEVPVAYFVDEKNVSRQKVTWLIAAVIFIVGLPSMLSQGVVPAFNKLHFYHDKTALDFVAEVFSELCLPLGGCLMCLFIVLRWGQHNMSKEIYEGNPGYEGSFLEKYINFTMRYVCPILLGIFSILIVLDKLFSVTLDDLTGLLGVR